MAAANALASFGDAHAVVMVRKLDSADITSLVGLGWRLAYLWDRNLDDLQFNGQPLYAGEKVKVGSDKNWAYVIPSFVVVKAGNDQLKTLVRSAM